MSDLDALFVKTPTGTGCWAQTQTTPEIRARLDELMEKIKEKGQDPEWSKVAEWVQGLGVDRSINAVKKHFRRQCRCFR